MYIRCLAIFIFLLGYAIPVHAQIMTETVGMPFVLDTHTLKSLGIQEIYIRHFEPKLTKNWDKKLKEPDYTDQIFLSKEYLPVRSVFCQGALCDTTDFTKSECDGRYSYSQDTLKVCNENGRIIYSGGHSGYIRNTYNVNGSLAEYLRIFSTSGGEKKTYLYEKDRLTEIVEHEVSVKTDWRTKQTDTIFTEKRKQSFFYVNGRLRETITTVEGNSEQQKVLYIYSADGLLSRMEYSDVFNTDEMMRVYIITFEYR